MTKIGTPNDPYQIAVRPGTIKDDDGDVLADATIVFASSNPDVLALTDNDDGTASGKCISLGDAVVNATVTSEGYDPVTFPADDVHVRTGAPFTAEFDSTITPAPADVPGTPGGGDGGGDQPGG